MLIWRNWIGWIGNTASLEAVKKFYGLRDDDPKEIIISVPKCENGLGGK